MLFKTCSPPTQNLGLCGHERAAAASGSNLPPKTLEMLSCRSRVKQRSRRMMHQLCSTLFFANISSWGSCFSLPQSHVPGARIAQHGRQQGLQKICSWVFYFLPHPTRWLKCCSLVISQAQVCRQLTSHSGQLGEKNIRKGMSGARGCFCFSFQLN